VKNKIVLRLFTLLLFITTFENAAATSNTQPSSSGDIKQLIIEFYGEQIPLVAHSDMQVQFFGGVEEDNMIRFYKELEETSFYIFLDELDKAKVKYNLNDWLYYKLMKSAVKELYPGKSKIQLELTTWFLLSKGGWNTRLAYSGNNVYVYVFTEDELFEIPMIDDNGKTFVNLSGIGMEKKLRQGIYMLNFTPGPNGHPFTFYLSSLPTFNPKKETRNYTFNFKGQQYQVDVKIDERIKQLMADYPIFAESEYLEVPFSETVGSSLIPQLKVFLNGKSDSESLEFLVSFTRSSFRYKKDQDYFGESKPMIAEEVFHYPFSDCEDRSALFYRLVKELLDLPMIIIAYPEHLTIAVAFSPKRGGDVINFKGRNYYVCDPTGPVNSSEIGWIPKEFRQSSFEIIGSYK
jgi:hypothetical protein